MKAIGFAMLSIAAFSMGTASQQAFAQGTDLAGSWSGGGTVTFAGGNRERARCRVRYTPQGATSYVLSGVCATDTARVEQIATLRKTGANTYSGAFTNSEFGVSGTIRVTVSGNSHTATLSSDGGSASLSMRRQ